jgi:hypothetical protein
MYPQRIQSLILVNLRSSYRELRAMTAVQRERFAKPLHGVRSLEVANPRVAHDPGLRQWWARARRLRSTREDNLAQVEWAAAADNESVLPSVRVPTLVLHRRDNRMFDIEASRAAANLIPNARFAELLGRHPMLAFHLELVELRVYAVPDSADLVVVPSIVGRTQEVTRAVVEIRNPGGAEVSVSVGLTEPPPDRTERLRSLEDFTVRATEAVGEARAAALTAIAEGWRDRVGGQVRLNKSSYSLYARAGSASVSVLTVYTRPAKPSGRSLPLRRRTSSPIPTRCSLATRRRALPARRNTRSSSSTRRSRNSGSRSKSSSSGRPPPSLLAGSRSKG